MSAPEITQDPSDINVSAQDISAKLDDLLAEPAAEPATPPPAEPSTPPAEPVTPPPAETPPPPGIPADVLRAHLTTATPPPAESDDPPPPAIANDPKANAAFAQLRAEIKKYKGQLSEKDAELAKLTAAPSEDELQALRTKLADTEKELGQYNLAATAEFKARFDQPLGDVVRKGTSLLLRAGKTQEEATSLVKELIASADSLTKVQELLADEPFAVQGALTAMVTDYADLSDARTRALSEWQETQAALNAQVKRQTDIQLMQDIETGTAAAMQEVLQAGNWMYARSADNEAWNQSVDERIKTVKGLMRSGKPAELVSMIMEGVTAKDTRDLVRMAQEQINNLQEQLKGLVKASPSIQRTPAPVGPGSPPTSGPRSTEQLLDEILKM